MYYSGDQNNDMMGGVCSTRGRVEKCIQNLIDKLKERGRLGDIGVGGTVILKCSLMN
jgi:methylmalonyl-CoA mutase cobalamin-binding subunit